MNTITHYAIRDLHALEPDDEQPGVHDVIAKTEDGRIFYSEDVFDDAVQAQTFLEQMLAEPYEFDHWEDKPVGAEHTGTVNWIEATAKEGQP